MQMCSMYNAYFHRYIFSAVVQTQKRSNMCIKTELLFSGRKFIFLCSLKISTFIYVEHIYIYQWKLFQIFLKLTHMFFPILLNARLCGTREPNWCSPLTTSHICLKQSHGMVNFEHPISLQLILNSKGHISLSLGKIINLLPLYIIKSEFHFCPSSCPLAITVSPFSGNCSGLKLGASFTKRGYLAVSSINGVSHMYKFQLLWGKRWKSFYN